MRAEARRRHSHAACARRGWLKCTATDQRGKAILRARARHERTARRHGRRRASAHACSARTSERCNARASTARMPMRRAVAARQQRRPDASSRFDHAAVAEYSSSAFSSSVAAATQVRKARARPTCRHAASARRGRARMASVCRQRTSASAPALPRHLFTASRRRRILSDQRRAASLHMAVAPNRAPIAIRRSSLRARAPRCCCRAHVRKGRAIARPTHRPAATESRAESWIF